MTTGNDRPPAEGASRAAQLADLLAAARERRSAFVARARAEGTDAWRLFHGVVEGRPGLTVDRYGELVLVQTFREPLAPGELDVIARECPGPLVWNHRAKSARAAFEDHHALAPELDREFVARELGVRYAVRARHRGIDPWLFLDLRAGRRALTGLCRDKSVLNLFAYTGAAGVAAVAHGAREAWNVDFARSSSDVARRHAELSDVDPARLTSVVEDVFPVVWQLAGLPVKGRGAARPYTRLEPRRFDVVFLDPPTFSKGPFGAVDLERDYESLFKPAVLATTAGGMVLATNHAAAVDVGLWHERLRRCASKAGRPVQALDAIEPDEDFPSFDGRPPLKIALVRL